jgi:DNA-binding transcriptional ArsR family regulator
MEPDADLAAVGRLIGDQNRARMLQVLLAGTPQSGSSLASAAGISRSLASAHLKKLTAGGLGAALAAELARRGWTRRLDGSRIVTVTPDGSAGLGAWLGLDLGRLRSDAAA